VRRTSGIGRHKLPIVCFSHLRWDFVFQRPQHVLTRADTTVLFIEEPIPSDRDESYLKLRRVHDDVHVAVPAIAAGEDAERDLRRIVEEAMLALGIDDHIAWYYTPAALPFTDHLAPRTIVYDCMDDLTGFDGADPRLPLLEETLLERADVVFTGGHALYGRMAGRHRNVHAFPSSVDSEHFGAARDVTVDPDDQREIPRPRIGFAGVIDERLDLDLVAAAAELRPEWSFVMLGPMVKIPPHRLPAGPNVHPLGMKHYRDLPRYLAGWDVAIMPFAKNRATRYISPTKTLEYLAAGLPVVSTSIADVVDPYGERGVVAIADDATSFVDAIDESLRHDAVHHLRRVDDVLRLTSWDSTARRMHALVAATPAPPQTEEVSA
jgi:glycosyltransferase involved in cell wall biosynthesis